MPAQLFGVEHILYIIISTIIGSVTILFGKKFAKTERSKRIFLKTLAFFLLVAITTNRLSQVYRYGDAQWYRIIPDSFCGMTSLVLALSVLFGKKDNGGLHFTWLLGIFGGISTVIYATFLDQGPTIFYLPTISGLIHHSLSAMTVVSVLMLGYMDITYKKWYYNLFGLTSYMTVGAFLMHTFNLSDAFHIAEPLLEGTLLTAWVMGPMYAVGYALVLFIAELIKRKKSNK